MDAVYRDFKESIALTATVPASWNSPSWSRLSIALPKQDHVDGFGSASAYLRKVTDTSPYIGTSSEDE